MTRGAGALPMGAFPTGPLPIGPFPIGILPTGAACTGAGCARGISAATAALTITRDAAVAIRTFIMRNTSELWSCHIAVHREPLSRTVCLIIEKDRRAIRSRCEFGVRSIFRPSVAQRARQRHGIPRAQKQLKSYTWQCGRRCLRRYRFVIFHSPTQFRATINTVLE